MDGLTFVNPSSSYSTKYLLCLHICAQVYGRRTIPKALFSSEFTFSDSLENHSRLNKKSEFVRKRKVKKRLANLHNSTVISGQSSAINNSKVDENLSKLETSTTSNTEFLSPEQWLENFYNGKKVLLSKQKSKQIKKQNNHNEKFKNFPMIQKHKTDNSNEIDIKHGEFFYSCTFSLTLWKISTHFYFQMLKF